MKVAYGYSVVSPKHESNTERNARAIAYRIFTNGESIKSRGKNANPTIVDLPATLQTEVLSYLRVWDKNSGLSRLVDGAELEQMRAMRKQALLNK